MSRNSPQGDESDPGYKEWGKGAMGRWRMIIQAQATTPGRARLDGRAWVKVS